MQKKSEERKIYKNNISRSKAAVPIPESLTATAGDSNGEIDLIWEPVYGARTYVIQKSYRRSQWIQEDIITKSSCTISRLKSGRKYWFRVAAVDSKGQGPWSDPVQKKVP